MMLRYYGNALFTMEQDGQKLLIDPYFSRNPHIYRPTAKDFDDVDTILITHGHFDHIEDLPKLLERRADRDIYCTRQTQLNMERLGMRGGRVHIIEQDDTFEVGAFRVRSIRSCHISFDFQYIEKHAVSREFYLGLPRALKMLYTFSRTPLGGECVEFLIEAGGESVLLAASLGADDTIEHPVEPDVFVMPYNGRWNLNEHMLKHVDRIAPKKILMSHFDAAFPPLCFDSQPERFREFMKRWRPNMPVVIPEYTKPYAVLSESREVAVEHAAELVLAR